MTCNKLVLALHAWLDHQHSPGLWAALMAAMFTKRPSADAQCYYNQNCSIQYINKLCVTTSANVWTYLSAIQTFVCPEPKGYCILGDGGYPCMSQPVDLVTPYRGPLRGGVTGLFNRHRAKACSVIERASGIMKTRWRSVFFKALEVHPAFAILHNLCIRDGDILEPVEEAPDDGGEQPQQDLHCGEQLVCLHLITLLLVIENMTIVKNKTNKKVKVKLFCKVILLVNSFK